MRSRLLSLLMLLALTTYADDALEPGLVAHYFRDPINWDGNWPDSRGTPSVSAAAWTFRSYAYSRNEPVINHLFINQGWFSIRWTGTIDTSLAGSVPGAETHTLSGEINLNPANSPNQEWILTLADGSAITPDDLQADYAGYTGKATSIQLKPKGNSNLNGLLVDHAPFPLLNARNYLFRSDWMTVKLYNTHDAAGQWWLSINAMEVAISDNDTPVRSGTAVAVTPTSKDTDEFLFEIWADDGCRLFIDGKALIDDWRAACEEVSGSLRRAAPIMLKPGKHRLVVEYFQGQSLKAGDRDPMKLYWTCPTRGVPRQVVPPTCLFHDRQDTTSHDR